MQASDCPGSYSLQERMEGKEERQENSVSNAQAQLREEQGCVRGDCDNSEILQALDLFVTLLLVESQQWTPLLVLLNPWPVCPTPQAGPEQ